MKELGFNRDLRYRESAPGAEPKKKRLSAGACIFALSAAALLVFPMFGIWNYFNPPPDEASPKKVEVPIGDEEWQGMVGGLKDAASAYRGNVGIYFKDLHTGKVWEYNSERLFPSASLIKVPIMAAAFEKIRLGEMTLDTQVTLASHDRLGGSGSLKWAREGTRLSVLEIIYRMITESDNTAANVLIKHMGIEFLQREFVRLGLVYTKINPEGLSLKSGRVERENYTTAREMAGLLERIYAGRLIDKDSSAQMLDFLKHNKSRSRLRRGLPLGWEIGHKTGLLRKSCHDVGIVFSPRGDYIIAVLTSDVPDYSSAKKFIAKVAKLTYKYYKIDADYAFSRVEAGSAIRSI